MTTCPCGTDTTTGWVCRVCVGRLRRDMERLAELWPETVTVLARQTATGSGAKVSTTGKERPLPFDDNASEVRWLVENTITTWTRDLAGDQTPDGVHDVPSACLWLAHSAQRVAGTQEGPDALDELRDALRQVVRLVDRPESPIYLGVHDCGSDVWAKSHRLYQMCAGCEVTLDLDALRAESFNRARDTFAPARVIVDTAKMYGVRISKQQISRWAAHDEVRKVESKPTLYHVGECVMMASRETKRETA